MAQLPQTYRQQLAPSGGGQIVQLPGGVTDTSMGDAIKRVGAVFGEVAERAQKAKLDGEVTRADRIAREKLDRLRLDIEQDASIAPEELPNRFTSQARKIVEEAGSGISSDMARGAWNESASGLVSEGDLWSRKLGVKRKIDGVKAEHVTTLKGLEATAGDLSLSEETYVANLGSARANIERDMARGFLSKEEAAIRMAALDDLRLSDVMARRSSDIEALVRAGDAAGADAVISAFEGTKAEKDKLAATKEATERQIRLEDNLAEEAIRKEQILTANRMETDILYGRVNEPMILKAASDGLISDNDVPSLIRAKRAFDDTVLSEARMSAADKALHTATSGVMKSEIMVMPADMLLSGPQNWAPEDRERFDAMTLADRGDVMEKITQMKARGQTSDAVKAMHSDLLSVAKLTAPTTWSMSGVYRGAMGNVNKQEESESERRFSGILYRLANEESIKTGGQPISPVRAKELIAKAYGEFGAIKGFTPPRVDVGGGRYVLRKDIDPELWAATRRRLQQNDPYGQTPSDAAVMRAYRAVTEMPDPQDAPFQRKGAQ